MRLFGRKKEKKPESVTYDLYGNVTIVEFDGGYKINWKGPAPMTAKVDKLDEDSLSQLHDMSNLSHPYDINIQIPPSVICQLRIEKEDGRDKAYFSKI